MCKDDGERIRRRSTAIVVREGRVLLVREPQNVQFDLPGGGVEQDELAVSAVARELQEETDLVATEIEYLFSYYEHWGEDGIHYTGAAHSVFSVKADGEVRLGPEIQEHMWWDGTSEIPLRQYVRPLLDMLQGAK